LLVVLHVIINIFQSAFINNKMIIDNMFLAHSFVKHYHRKGISPKAML